jgi:hypothetical protein
VAEDPTPPPAEETPPADEPTPPPAADPDRAEGDAASDSEPPPPPPPATAGAISPPRPARPHSRPLLSRIGVSGPTASRRGIALRYVLSRSATVTITIARRGAHHHARRVAVVTHRRHAGTIRERVARRLAAGRYIVKIAATATERPETVRLNLLVRRSGAVTSAGRP